MSVDRLLSLLSVSARSLSVLIGTAIAAIFVLSASSIAVLGGDPPPFAGSHQRSHFAPDRLIVQFQQRIDPREVEIDGRSVTLTEVHRIDILNIKFGVDRIERLFPSTKHHRAPAAFRSLGMDRTYVLYFNRAVDVPAVAAGYAAERGVVYAEPDLVRDDTLIRHRKVSRPQNTGLAQWPDDTLFGRQWNLTNDGTNCPSTVSCEPDADIDAELAWDITVGSSSIVVAVLDGGLKWDHPDIDDRVWQNVDETHSNGEDDDGNGYSDDIRGWNFADDDNDVMDETGHGTSVAYVIGAESDNNEGYAGVDWKARIMPLKVIDSEGRAYDSWVASAIQYAVDNGARVVNVSVSGPGSSTAVGDAIEYAYQAGGTVVASMGNTNDNVLKYPAAYEHTIAVGATNPDDSRASPFCWGNGGSSFGDHIDVTAPGNYIFGMVQIDGAWTYGGYWCGTSVAAPHVSGLVALLLAQGPTRTFEEVRDIIRNTAEDEVGPSSEDEPGFDVYFGYGRINVHQALLQTGRYDVNNDGRVDGDDVAKLALHWRMNSNHPDWPDVQRFDFDDSGNISVADIMEEVNAAFGPQP